MSYLGWSYSLVTLCGIWYNVLIYSLTTLELRCNTGLTYAGGSNRTPIGKSGKHEQCRVSRPVDLILTLFSHKENCIISCVNVSVPLQPVLMYGFQTLQPVLMYGFQTLQPVLMYGIQALYLNRSQKASFDSAQVSLLKTFLGLRNSRSTQLLQPLKIQKPSLLYYTVTTCILNY